MFVAFTFAIAGKMSVATLRPRIVATTRYASTLIPVAHRQTRSYFSRFHPEPEPFPKAQSTILAAALKRVPEYGFTNEALTLGAKDVGYLDVSIQLFPRGAFDLINYHLITQRLALKSNVQFSEDGANLGVSRKIKTLTMARLRANEDVIHRWQDVSCVIPSNDYV